VRRLAGAGDERREDRGDDAVGGDPGSAEVRDSPISEVILALTPSVEGDTTSLYLARLIKPFTTVSRIAYGLPMGSELEYADEVTLARAFEGRRAVE
jgi:recombination protein RecR